MYVIRIVCDALPVLPANKDSLAYWHKRGKKEAEMMISYTLRSESDVRRIRDKILHGVEQAVANIGLRGEQVLDGAEIYCHERESLGRALSALRLRVGNEVWHPFRRNEIRVVSCQYLWQQKYILSQGCTHVLLPSENCIRCVRLEEKEQKRVEYFSSEPSSELLAALRGEHVVWTN